MSYLGDFAASATVATKFTTIDSNGAPATLGNSPSLVIYKAGTTVEFATGATLTVNYDGVTGLNDVSIDCGTTTQYATGADYQIVIAAGTVTGVPVVGYVVGTFSIANRKINVLATGVVTASSIATAAMALSTMNVVATSISVGVTVTAIVTSAITASSIATNALALSTVLVGTVAVTSISAGVTVTTMGVGVTVVAISTGAVTASSIATNALALSTVLVGTVEVTSIAVGVTVTSMGVGVTVTAMSVGVTVTAMATGVVTASVIATNGLALSTVLVGTVAVTSIAVGVTITAIVTGAITASSIATNALALSTVLEVTNGATLTTAERNAIADAIIARNVAGGSSTGRTVKDALAFIRNKWTISGSTLTVYDTDDTSTLWTATIATTAGDPVSSVDPA